MATPKPQVTSNNVIEQIAHAITPEKVSTTASTELYKLNKHIEVLLEKRPLISSKSNYLNDYIAYIEELNTLFSKNLTDIVEMLNKKETVLTPDALQLCKQLCFKLATAATPPKNVNSKNIQIITQDNALAFADFCQIAAQLYTQKDSAAVDTLAQAAPQVIEVLTNAYI